MIKKLKKDVCEANKKLVEHELVLFTWGNVSAIDREKNIVAIKPSGVKYEDLTPDKIVVLDLNGNKIEGDLNPSSDTWTHLEIYRRFPKVNAIVHTHSENATAFAQANVPIECLGTTHADHFCGDIPIIPKLPTKAIVNNYERNTGVIICNYFDKNRINPNQMEACLVYGHGPFVWGKNLDSAIYNSVVLEAVARMNIKTITLNEETKKLPQGLLKKHYFRKHGRNKYYGQK
jgi:L-ribulose-5-phosphate 4-epimerase